MKIWPFFAIAGGAIALVQLDIVQISDFVRVGCRGKQVEATSMLKESRKRLNDYGNRNGGKLVYSFDDLGWHPKAERYAYRIDLGFNGHFTIEASATTPEMNGDVWQIDELGTLTNKVNGCAR